MLSKEDAPRGVGRDRAVNAIDGQFARDVLEAAPAIIYVYDLKLDRRIFQTRRMSELLGHAPAPDRTAKGEWSRLIHPEDEVHYSIHRAQLNDIRDGQVMSWEFRMRDSNGEWRWFLGRDVLLKRDANGAARLVVGCASEVTEQKAVEELKDIVASEMRHRAKNLTAVIEALSRQSRPKDKPEVGAYFDTFVGRLSALLNTGDIILASRERLADLREVSKTALSPFRSPEASGRFTVDGPAVMLTEQTAGGLALAFHELATNAVKYGALSNSGGTISLSWSRHQSGSANLIVIEWKEHDGPKIAGSSYEGFGSKLIRFSVSREPGGDVRIDVNPDGLYCRIQFEQTPV